MVNPYRHADWLAFRLEVIRLDNSRCVRCFKGDGVVLQVHHKHYVGGRLPWEYPLTDCETLCKGCHAEEHGHIMPRSGWLLVGTDDLGDLSGVCELCGTDLRYTFAIVHPSWGSMMVGTNCCDRLTATDEASRYMDGFGKRRDKLARFVQSTRWKGREGGASLLSQAGSTYRIQPDGEVFKIVVNGEAGRKQFGSVIEARKHLFDIMESGAVDQFIVRQRRKRLSDARILGGVAS